MMHVHRNPASSHGHTSSSGIGWSKPIPEIAVQLYTKYDLTKSEPNFIESMIKPME